MRINKGNWTGETATIAATGNKLNIAGEVYTIRRLTNSIWKVYGEGDQYPTATVYKMPNNIYDKDSFTFVAFNGERIDQSHCQREADNRNEAIAQLLFNIT